MLKDLLIPRDFFDKVNEKTGKDYWYFAEQYFYTPLQPELKYYQTDTDFYFKWNNVNDNFSMPLDLLVNGSKKEYILPKIINQYLAKSIVKLK